MLAEDRIHRIDDLLGDILRFLGLIRSGHAATGQAIHSQRDHDDSEDLPPALADEFSGHHSLRRFMNLREDRSAVDSGHCRLCR